MALFQFDRNPVLSQLLSGVAEAPGGGRSESLARWGADPARGFADQRSKGIRKLGIALVHELHGVVRTETNKLRSQKKEEHDVDRMNN